MAKGADRSFDDALTQVFREDPDLYQRYRQGARTDAAPGSETPVMSELLALATALNPEDPLGRGMARSRLAVAELTKTVLRKRTAA